jgi:single-stranded-DNA-specific exonuclease
MSVSGRNWNILGFDDGATSLDEQLLKIREIDRTSIYPQNYGLLDFQNQPVMEMVEFIDQAINAGTHITVLGDYDVDGSTACAALGLAFEMRTPFYDLIVPDRFNEGYGLSDKATDRILVNATARGGKHVVICVDNGTLSHDQIVKLRNNDIEVGVIDHHPASGAQIAPANVLLNPKITGPELLEDACAGLLSCIVAAQLAYKWGAYSPALEAELLQFAAISTIADMVPLMNANRSFAAAGLKKIKETPSIPIRALFEAANRETSLVSSSDIAFVVGPCLNAPGRMVSGAVSANYLLSKNSDQALKLARDVVAINETRKSTEKTAVSQAMKMAEGQIGVGGVFSNEWHLGVVGLIAARLTEFYGRPFIAGRLEDGVIKGSGRSVGNIDLGSVVAKAKREGLLISGGGHAMACGFSCEEKKFDELREFLTDNCKIENEFEPEPIVFDISIPACHLKTERWERVQRLEPFGQGFKYPSVVMQGTVKSIFNMKDGGIKLSFENSPAEAIVFGAKADRYRKFIAENISRNIEIGGNASISTWQGKRTVSLQISDMRESNAKSH